MIDPSDPLAHLYADLDDELEEPAIVHREGTLDDLVNEPLHEEPIIDSDVTELALLVEAAQAAGTSSDEYLAELGLGEFQPVTVCALCDKGPEDEIHEGPADTENLHLFDPFEADSPAFDLNALGLAVTRRMAERAGLIPRGAQ